MMTNKSLFLLALSTLFCISYAIQASEPFPHLVEESKPKAAALAKNFNNAQPQAMTQKDADMLLQWLPVDDLAKLLIHATNEQAKDNAALLRARCLANDYNIDKSWNAGRSRFELAFQLTQKNIGISRDDEAVEILLIRVLTKGRSCISFWKTGLLEEEAMFSYLQKKKDVVAKAAEGKYVYLMPDTQEALNEMHTILTDPTRAYPLLIADGQHFIKGAESKASDAKENMNRFDPSAPINSYDALYWPVISPLGTAVTSLQKTYQACKKAEEYMGKLQKAGIPFSFYEMKSKIDNVRSQSLEACQTLQTKLKEVETKGLISQGGTDLREWHQNMTNSVNELLETLSNNQ